MHEVNASEFDYEAASFVTLARIYDLLAVIARGVNKEAADEVLDAHEHGVIIGSVPYIEMRTDDGRV